MGRPLKLILICCASLLVLGIGTVVLFTTSPGESIIKGWLEKKLSTEAGLPISIAMLETNLWSRASIDTLRVMPVAEEGGTPILYVGRVRIGYSLLDLLGATLALEMVEIDSVALGLEIDSLGGFGIPMLDNSTNSNEVTDEPATAVVIDSIMLGRIGLHYLDTNLPLAVELSGTLLTARGDRDGSYSGHLTVETASVTYDSLTLHVRDFDVSAALSNETIQIAYARAECEGLDLKVTGEIGLSASQDVSLKASVEGSLDSLASATAAAYGTPLTRAGAVGVNCLIEGPIDALRISLDGSLGRLVLPSLIIDSVRVRARYAQDEIRIDDLWLSMLEGTISGTARTALDSMSGTFIDLHLEGLALPKIWETVYSETSPYRGVLDGTIGVRGSGSDWKLWAYDAEIVGSDLQYENRSIPDLKCSVSQKSGRTALSLVHGADEIRADLALSADSVHGTFDVLLPDLTALARLFDQPELSGELGATGTIEGTYADPVLRASVFGSNINYRNFPGDTLVADLSYVDSQLTLVDFVCKGRLDSINSVNPPFDLDSISGALSYECRLSGTWDNLQGEVSVELIAPSYAEYSLDSLVTEVSLEGSRIEVKRLEASRDEVGARLEAVYDRTSGAGSIDIQLISHVARPDDPRDDAGTDSSMARDELGSISGDFTLGPDSDVSAAVSGKGLWLGLISKLSEDSVLVDGEADFELVLDGRYLSPVASLDTKIRSLALAGYGVDSVSAYARMDSTALWLDSLTSYAFGHTLQSTGKLDLATTDDGSIGVDPDGIIRGTLDTRDFDLSTLSGFILPGGELTGTFSAAMRVSGTMSLPHFDGWLTAEDGTIVLSETAAPIEDIELSMTFADTVFSVDSASGNISDIPFRASGSLATSQFESVLVDLEMRVGSYGRLTVAGQVADTSVSLEITSDTLDLAVFQPFLPQLDSISGRLGSRMKLEGDPSAPGIDGSLQARSVAFVSRRHHIRCSDGYADIHFDDDRVILDTVSAALNGGEVILSGSVTHDQGEPIDIDLSTRAIHITLEELGTYAATIDSAAFNYGRRNENYVLEGDLILGEARFTAGLRPTSVLPWVQSIETVDMELPELISRSRLDVRIRKSNNLWVDNNLARIRLHAELGVIGTPLRPNFTGVVRVEEGYLLYLDRRFQVSEGSVYFNDPTRFNPDINLNANTQITTYRRTTAEQYKIYIKAEGLLDQLQYGLYSEPSLERSDIVALLTLGATRSELTNTDENGNRGGLTQVLKDRAAMLTSQRVSGFLSRQAGSMFGFDQFTIQGNLFQFGNNWGPQLVASKRLSQRVDFTYSTTVGQLNDQVVKLGYRFAPRWSLIGETDRQGRSGLDLNFGIKFK